MAKGYWSTPQARDWKNLSPSGRRARRKEAQGWSVDLSEQAVEWSQQMSRYGFWPTPNAHPESKANKSTAKVGPGYPKWSPNLIDAALEWSKKMADKKPISPAIGLMYIVENKKGEADAILKRIAGEHEQDGWRVDEFRVKGVRALELCDGFQMRLIADPTIWDDPPGPGLLTVVRGEPFDADAMVKQFNRRRKAAPLPRMTVEMLAKYMDSRHPKNRLLMIGPPKGPWFKAVEVLEERGRAVIIRPPDPEKPKDTPVAKAPKGSAKPKGVPQPAQPKGEQAPAANSAHEDDDDNPFVRRHVGVRGYDRELETLRGMNVRLTIVRTFAELLKIVGQFVGTNLIRFLIVVGYDGVGKTTAFKGAKGMYVIKGAGSDTALHCDIWAAHSKGYGFLLMDDMDNVFGDRLQVEILKMVTNDSDPREIIRSKALPHAAHQAGVQQRFFTSIRVAMLLNSLGTLAANLKNVGAGLKRGKIIFFCPGPEEVHKFVGTWWNLKEHKDIYDFLGANLRKMSQGDIRWYKDALREKELGNDWREWLRMQWVVENPDVEIVSEIMRTLPPGKQRILAWKQKTGKSEQMWFVRQAQYRKAHGPDAECKGGGDDAAGAAVPA